MCCYCSDRERGSLPAANAAAASDAAVTAVGFAVVADDGAAVAVAVVAVATGVVVVAGAAMKNSVQTNAYII